MEEDFISKKEIVIVFLFSIFIIFFVSLNNYFNSSGYIVFCDVGQGDATYIRLKNRTDILIDAGGDRKVLTCLGKFMPFYDKTIELAFISHPQKDHFGGYEYIIDRYKLKLLFLNQVNIDSKSYGSLVDKVNKKNIKIKNLFANDLIILNDVKIKSLWPEKNIFEKNKSKILI